MEEPGHYSNEDAEQKAVRTDPHPAELEVRPDRVDKSAAIGPIRADYAEPEPE